MIKLNMDLTKAIAKTAIDPVCGMSVDVATSKHKQQYSGQLYHFCSSGRMAKFSAAPADYLDGAVISAMAATDAMYTCPMHTQIRQAGPGSCPICGMALEPVEVSAVTHPNHELADITL